jgi:hypothetical protein
MSYHEIVTFWQGQNIMTSAELEAWKSCGKFCGVNDIIKSWAVAAERSQMAVVMRTNVLRQDCSYDKIRNDWSCERGIV